MLLSDFTKVDFTSRSKEVKVTRLCPGFTHSLSQIHTKMSKLLLN